MPDRFATSASCVGKMMQREHRRDGREGARPEVLVRPEHVAAHEREPMVKPGRATEGAGSLDHPFRQWTGPNVVMRSPARRPARWAGVCMPATEDFQRAQDNPIVTQPSLGGTITSAVWPRATEDNRAPFASRFPLLR